MRYRPLVRAGKDVFERWVPIWHVFFYAMIVIALGLWFRDRQEIGHPVLVPVLAAGIAAWHVVMVVRPGITAASRERPVRMAIYLAGAIVMSAALVSIHPVFLMIAMTLYNQIFAFMVTRWAMPAAIALTAIVGAGAMRGSGSDGVLVVLISGGAALMFALFLTASSEESQKRRLLIEELQRTREELAFAERLAGVTQERHRLQRDLHDTVTQQLVAIVMELEAHITARGSGEWHAGDDTPIKVLQLAREGLAEARRLVWAERPAQLEAASLTRALTTLLERTQNDAKLTVEHDLGEELDLLSAAQQTLVLRAVQESLANVKKHARAKRVMVSAHAEEGVVTLDVNDDGIGFDPALSAARARGALGGGFGLRGLRERVEALGGTLTIESAQGGGTTVAVHVPTREKA